ncbi:hypothetical protein K8R03_03340 [Candidatus Kaiserbacteria bacterium]|nr:hypothetical protein [Candidatus Kaiserbacteria bacterium]
MVSKRSKKTHPLSLRHSVTGAVLGVFALVVFGYIGFGPLLFGNAVAFDRAGGASATTSVPVQKPKVPALDRAAYDLKMQQLANYPVEPVATSTATSTASTTPAKAKPWPVKNAPYPKAGALLPFNRIVAYYGNFYSKGMGVLGQYPEDIMLDKLRAAVHEWELADPSTPVIPAIHYIVSTAQESAGASGMYSALMPDSQVDKAIEIAAKVHGIVLIDFQVGKSTLQAQLPQYEKYLAMPNVHLGIDPEFSMKTGARPGTVIGSFDAEDINYAANYLAKLVREHDLPPKILVIHRFTLDMVTGYKRITPLPEVQIVMDMDGWGSPQRKQNTYYHVVSAEPVQFTGFKLFYKNDLKEVPPRMMTPAEVLKLIPQPIYIQYQ